MSPSAPSTIRPPVVAILGHIDHGKSALLDYIRKTNIVAEEAGGITQRLSAYEVEHAHEGKAKRITFLDTPGHEAFQSVRSHGANVADIAILVVSAEEGVKAQTLEAVSAIKSAGIPFIVALTKIDKPNANLDRAKQSLAEKEIYLEGLGGDVPYQALSSKTGEGIPELLDLILLVAELAELKGNSEAPAEGVIIESHLDKQKGVSATLLVKEGTLRTGSFVVAGKSIAPVRILEDYLGRPIDSATFSAPVRVVGWSEIPEVGTPFKAVSAKKEAEQIAGEFKPEAAASIEAGAQEERLVVPVILKAGDLGTLPALEHEIGKIKSDRVALRVIQKSVGDITEGDVKLAGGKAGTVILGFNVAIDPLAKEPAERLGVTLQTFDIIYRLSEWLSEYVKKVTPSVTAEEEVGSGKVLKTFGQTKQKQVVGVRVLSGSLAKKGDVKILRRNEEVGRGKILNLQRLKTEVSEVREGEECGVEIESAVDIASGDVLCAVKMVTT